MKNDQYVPKALQYLENRGCYARCEYGLTILYVGGIDSCQCNAKVLYEFNHVVIEYSIFLRLLIKIPFFQCNKTSYRAKYAKYINRSQNIRNKTI